MIWTPPEVTNTLVCEPHIDLHACDCGGRYEIVPNREQKTCSPPLCWHKCDGCGTEKYIFPMFSECASGRVI